MRSESTSALGQPRLTNPTLGCCRDMRRRREKVRNYTGWPGSARRRDAAQPLRRREMPLRGRPTPRRRIAGLEDAMGEWIHIDTAAGPVRAWFARPDKPARGALVVLQEIFGVNPHIRAVADG